MSGAAVKLDEFHSTLWADVQAGASDRAGLNALGHSCDEECDQCAAVFCPLHHPFHYHHDGCPACLEMDVGYESPVPVEAGA